jgi:hypothetical protein
LVRPIGIRFREASTKVHHPGCSGLPVLTGILYPGGPPRPAYPVSAVKARLRGGAASPGNVYPTPGWVGGGVGCSEEDPRAVSMVETRYGARCALLARASRKHPLRIAKGQTEGIPSAATLLSCVGLSVFCTRKCNSQGPLLDLALTQSLTWPPSALIDHFTRARGPAVLREEMYGTFGAHAFLSPVVCIRDPPLALAGLPA